MEQSTLNRGHLAFIEDQIRGAAEAFRAGATADVVEILKSVSRYIDQWLEATEGRHN